MIRNFLTRHGYILIFAAILALALRGLPGNPPITELRDEEWKEDGPFELSPERGRYALAYSLVEDGSFHFSAPLARFILPDVGYHEGRYVSLFAPGVSFLVIPGYLIGKYFSIAQVGTYATIALFALLNAVLVRSLAIRLGAEKPAALISAIVFLFATPAFSYAVSLYQHHISVSVLLLALYALVSWHPFWSPVLVWFLFTASVSIDYPNAIFLLPIALFALLKVGTIQSRKNELSLRFDGKGLVALLIMIFPIAFFFWTNQNAYGNPFTLSGTVEDVGGIAENGAPIFHQERTDELSFTQQARKGTNPFAFFKTRNIMRGLRVHLASLDRGIMWYSPVALFGILGAIELYRKHPRFTELLVSIVGVNLLAYSMWGDPWGGWAFGSRYLIPSYAILSMLTAMALTKIRARTWILAGFFLILSYSVAVNTLGAVTTNRVPPKEEAIDLERKSDKEEPYTFLRNWEHLHKDGTKSFLYRQLAESYMNAKSYYFLLTALILAVSSASVARLKFSGGKRWR